MIENIETIKENVNLFHKEIKNRLRLPIVITYSIILVLFNWDIIFYLSFENDSALNKIEFVKNTYKDENFHRIWIPILIAIFYSLLFPIIQILLNFILQVFKKINNRILRKEELDQAIHNFNVQQQLTGKQTLQQLQNRIDQLVLENQKLIETNNSLIGQLNSDTELIDSNKIFNNEFDKKGKEILILFNKLSNTAKTTFIEILNYISVYDGYYSISSLKDQTIYPNHITTVLEIFDKHNILEFSNRGSYNEQIKTTLFGKRVLQYFKNNFLK